MNLLEQTELRVAGGQTNLRISASLGAVKPGSPVRTTWWFVKAIVASTLFDPGLCNSSITPIVPVNVGLVDWSEFLAIPQDILLPGLMNGHDASLEVSILS